MVALKIGSLTDVQSLIFFAFFTAQPGGNLAVPLIGIGAVLFPDIILMDIAIAILSCGESIGKSNLTRGSFRRSIYCTAVRVVQPIQSKTVAPRCYLVLSGFRQGNGLTLSGLHLYFPLFISSSQLIYTEDILPVFYFFGVSMAAGIRQGDKGRLGDNDVTPASDLHIHCLPRLRRSEGVSLHLHGKACRSPVNVLRDLIRTCFQPRQLKALPCLQHHGGVFPVRCPVRAGNQGVFIIFDFIVIDDLLGIASFRYRCSDGHPAAVIHRQTTCIPHTCLVKSFRHFFFSIFGPGDPKKFCRRIAHILRPKSDKQCLGVTCRGCFQ